MRRESYGDRYPTRARMLAVVTILFGIGYLTWRVGWTLEGRALWLSIPLLVAEIYGWIMLAVFAFFAWDVPASHRPPRPRHEYSVDVFVCTYDEPLNLLRATLTGCNSIEYPHVTYVLDDGHRPQVAQLAAELGAQYITRTDNAHAKAGNINNALPQTFGELILTLDADHVPMPAILDATVGYFTDERAALVQTPHVFANLDSVQHTKNGWRHEQQLFFDVVLPGKDRHNSVFWCGSATILRRAALADIGGVATETIAEDMHTTMRMHARGWHTRYHNETLVQGLAPYDMAAFLKQRNRWSVGNLQVFRTPENPLTCRGLTLKQRISYMGSLLHYFTGWQRVIILAVPIIALVTGQLPLSAPPYLITALWVPAIALSWISSLVLSRGCLGPFDGTKHAFFTMGIYVRATSVLVRKGNPRFRVTPKEGEDLGGPKVFRDLLLLTVLVTLLTLSLGLRAADMAGLIRLPPLTGFALFATFVISLYLAGQIWQFLLTYVFRRQRRHTYRREVRLHASANGVHVIIDDLTPLGIGFLSPVPFGRGAELVVRTRAPDGHGGDTSLALPALVCHSARMSPKLWHVGTELLALKADMSRKIYQYYAVTLPESLYSAPPRPDIQEPTPLREAAATLHTR